MAAINPFEITKAVDYTDEQILANWVDFNHKGAFESITKPTSPVPMVILGGKGSGKTHLMRYFSYSTQKIRAKCDIVDCIRTDEYIGIYLRSSTLNSDRFSNKGIDALQWDNAFAYYMELWLARIILDCINDIYKNTKKRLPDQRVIASDIIALFLSIPENVKHPPDTLRDVIEVLSNIQRSLDLNINNSVMSKKLEMNININRGDFIFGIPRILANRIKQFNDIKFLYLIDEFENLTERQQRYFNTLVREKVLPSSFKIGARLYGYKTKATLSESEFIKEGSEYETLWLDKELSKSNGKFSKFAKNLCAQRLSSHDFNLDIGKNFEKLSHYFLEMPQQDPRNPDILGEKPLKRKHLPHMDKLRKKIQDGVELAVIKGVHTGNDIDTIIRNLTVSTRPFLEKINTFIFYKYWFANKIDMIEASEQIHDSSLQYLRGDNIREYSSVIDHFKSDMLAQLRRELSMRQYYSGLDNIIALSNGIPRNFLVILKHIYKWAIFNSESPFTSNPVTILSQHKGIMEAAEWFYTDARMPGKDGLYILDSINKIATLLRDIRFSDKPSECSPCTFSLDRAALSDEANRIIDLGVSWSLLIEVSAGRKDRNSKKIDSKFRINPMLSPKWDLPLAMRGVVSLTSDEANSIFDWKLDATHKDVIKKKIARMNAPLFGKQSKLRRNQFTKSLFDKNVDIDDEL